MTKNEAIAIIVDTLAACDVSLTALGGVRQDILIQIAEGFLEDEDADDAEAAVCRLLVELEIAECIGLRELE